MGVRTVCVDFDGVLNTYDGWKGPDHFHPPREGAREFLQALQEQGYEVALFTTRQPDKVWAWLVEYDLYDFVAHVGYEKLPAVAYIDDRAIRFDGDFDAVLGELKDFKAHWEKGR